MTRTAILLRSEMWWAALWLILRGGDNMVDIYVALIIAGRRTFARVPAKFKDAVKADLASLGLDENGNPVAVTE